MEIEKNMEDEFLKESEESEKAAVESKTPKIIGKNGSLSKLKLKKSETVANITTRSKSSIPETVQPGGDDESCIVRMNSKL